MKRLGNFFKKLRGSHPLAWLKHTFSHPIPKLKGLLTNGYTKFVARKTMFYLVVAFVAISFAFVIPHLMPGDPVDIMLSRGTPTPGYDPSVVAARLRHYFGFDRPLLDQYLSFWGNFFSGDLGPAFSYFPKPALDIVLERLPFTLILVIPVLILSFVIGNWVGARAGFLKGKVNDTAYFALVFSNRMPTFWWGMIVILLFVGILRILPTPGYVTLGTIGFTLELSVILDVMYHWIFPFVTLIVVYLGGWATGMRSMVTHEMDSGYVRYGEQLGFKGKKLMSYAERNAMLPQFTGLNLQLNNLVGESAIIEILFGWPGVGNLLYVAVSRVDYSLMMATFLVIITIVILGNFLIDILYGFIDPRVRTGQRR
jgi:peptide/nickel transport system permease protein